MKTIDITIPNENLEDILCSQGAISTCVAFSFVNGLVALKDNYLVRNTSNPAEIKEKMKKLALDMFSIGQNSSYGMTPACLKAVVYGIKFDF